MMNVYEWPYPNEFGVRETIESDLLVLGGGLAGDRGGSAGTARHAGRERRDGAQRLGRERL